MKLKYIIDKVADLEMTHNEESKVYVEEQYKISGQLIELYSDLYQKSWNEINNDFSDYIETQTGYNWYYPEYQCVVSVIHSGISNWGNGAIIFRTWQENPHVQRRITAHELILSHYFEIYKHNFTKHNLTDGQVWALAEIAALALTSLPSEVKSFWPWDKKGYYYFPMYPQLHKLIDQLKEVFINKKNFAEYMEKGMELIKEYPDIKP